MKIILISPIRSDMGLCTISPLLKKEGYRVNLLFVPGLLENCLSPLSKKGSARIMEFIDGADLVGINGFSENYHKTAALIEDIKKTTMAPVVWGGIHATLKPQDCLKHADIVCVGEGEEPMLELARKLKAREGSEGIKNLLFRSDENSIKVFELRAPINLDSLPPLDYDLDSQYIIEENSKIRNLKEQDFGGAFFSYSSRGCPFKCTYCCNAVIHSMYDGGKFCRQRSIENTIGELKEIKRRFSSCKEIWFNEADFVSGKTQKDIEDFSKRYKAEIDIPFDIWSHPNAINDESIRSLRDAGFRRVNLGTVHASDRIQRQIYKRNATPDLYLTKAKILKRYGIDIEYDVILCNPYEDDNDVVDTIKLFMQIPKPYRIALQYMTYFPKTELYDMAVRDGIIKTDSFIPSYRKAAYKVWKFQGPTTYVNIVFSMMRGKAKRIGPLGLNYYGILPEPVLKFLIKRPIVNFFNHLPLRSLIYRGIAGLVMLGNTASKKISDLTRKFKGGA